VQLRNTPVFIRLVKGIEAGIYSKVHIEPYYDDTDLEPSAARFRISGRQSTNHALLWAGSS
jgi:hypothetical protein